MPRGLGFRGSLARPLRRAAGTFKASGGRCRNFRLRAFGGLGRSNGLRRFDRRRCIRQPGRFDGRATDLGGSPCGDAAANLSLNISEAETFSGAEITGDRSGSDAKISLKAGRTGRAATTVGFLTRGASNAALFTEGIDAGAENVGVDGPGAAQHEARDRDTAEEIVGKDLTGRFPAVVHRRTGRTLTLTHSHNAQNNNSTKSPFDAASGKVPGSVSQRHGASLRRLLVKSGLNAGRCKAGSNAWNYWGNLRPK